MSLGIERLGAGVMAVGLSLGGAVSEARAEVEQAMMLMFEFGGHHAEEGHGKKHEHEGHWHWQFSGLFSKGRRPGEQRLLEVEDGAPILLKERGELVGDGRVRAHGHYVYPFFEGDTALGEFVLEGGGGIDAWLSDGPYLFSHFEALGGARLGPCGVELSVVVPHEHRRFWNVSGGCNFKYFKFNVAHGWDLMADMFSFPEGALEKVSHADLQHLKATQVTASLFGVGGGVVWDERGIKTPIIKLSPVDIWERLVDKH